MTDFLPPKVAQLIHFPPIEEVALEILRKALEPDVTVSTLIPHAFDFDYYLLCRRQSREGWWEGDHRFVDNGGLVLHAYTRDPDGDQKGALLSEAARAALYNAWRSQEVYQGGHIMHLELQQEPRRVTDWATATGPVQYADLPAGFWRYETTYDIKVRRRRGVS